MDTSSLSLLPESAIPPPALLLLLNHPSQEHSERDAGKWDLKDFMAIALLASPSINSD